MVDELGATPFFEWHKDAIQIIGEHHRVINGAGFRQQFFRRMPKAQMGEGE